MAVNSEAGERLQAHPHWKRNAVLFLSGQTSSMFGSLVVQHAVMWWITFETKSGLAIALWAVAGFLPQGLISIFGGVLADRMNRKALAMIADGGIALATLVLALLMSIGITELWIILLAVAVRSVGAGFQAPAVQAMIPQIVPHDQLLRINGLFQTIQSAMMLLAPVAAGVVFAAFGVIPVFFIDVITALIGIGLLAMVAVPTLTTIAEKTTGYRADLAEGARYIWTHRIVRWLLIVFAIIFLLTVAPMFVTPLMVARSFGTEVWMVAVLEIVFSIGMLLSGILVSTVFAGRSRIGLILLSTIGYGVVTIGLGLSPNLWVFYIFMFGFGLLTPLFSAPFMTFIQETVEPDKHGRVFSYLNIVMATAAPIGLVAFGPLADLLSIEHLLVIAGIVTILVTAIAVFVPSGRAAIRLSRTTQSTAAATSGRQPGDSRAPMTTDTVDTERAG